MSWVHAQVTSSDMQSYHYSVPDLACLAYL